MKKRLLKYSFYLVLLGFFSIALFFYMVKWGVFGPIPTEEQLKKIEQDEATIVTDRFGNLLGSFHQSNRMIIEFDNIPFQLSNALIATEDVRFYEHHGIDWRSW